MSLGTRSRFVLPEGVVYLDGNSLGALPVGVPDRLVQVARTEWGRDLIGSWNAAGWIDLATRVGDRIAPLIGAGPGEVIVGDSTSVSLFKAMSAALRHRPDRRVIVLEPSTFPTDGYVASGVAELLGAELRWCDPAEPLDSVGEDVALLSLTHVDFRTGAMYDLPAITAGAHEQGALVLWDLCHSAGAVPVDLRAAGADLAVGCTYKYLNGGPGSPAFTWVAPSLVDVLAQPITGWMGHAAPFAMQRDYDPAPGIRRWASGTPPILALSALDAALDAFDGISMTALRAESLALTGHFLSLLATRLPSLEVLTPLDPDRRGSQVSVRHEHAYGIIQALIARGVVGDYRDDPGSGSTSGGIARFGVAPLYVSRDDITRAVQELADVLATEAHLSSTYSTRPEGSVT